MLKYNLANISHHLFSGDFQEVVFLQFLLSLLGFLL